MQSADLGAKPRRLVRLGIGIARRQLTAAPLSARKERLRTDAHDAGRPTARPVAQVATSTSLVKAEPTPGFVLARVFAADGAGVAARVRYQTDPTGGAAAALVLATSEGLASIGRFEHGRGALAGVVLISAPIRMLTADAVFVGAALSAGP